MLSTARGLTAEAVQDGCGRSNGSGVGISTGMTHLGSVESDGDGV